jgi:hypothetical protein
MSLFKEKEECSKMTPGLLLKGGRLKGRVVKIFFQKEIGLMINNLPAEIIAFSSWGEVMIDCGDDAVFIFKKAFMPETLIKFLD